MKAAMWNQTTSTPTSGCPNPCDGSTDKEHGKVTAPQNFQCLRCREAGHRAYECPTKRQK